MRKISLSICLAFAFFVAAAVAQMAPGGSQGTQSSPSAGHPGSAGQQPGMSQPDNTTPMGQNNPNQKGAEKGEKKLKGCVQSQGGQYVLETKKGKAVNLTGQDLSAHVGHEVMVKGTWESGGAGSAVSSSGNASGSEKTFNVTSVDLISQTCGGKAKGSSGNMGTPPSGAGTGGSYPSGTGTGTQPPQ